MNYSHSESPTSVQRKVCGERSRSTMLNFLEPKGDKGAHIKTIISETRLSRATVYCCLTILRTDKLIEPLEWGWYRYARPIEVIPIEEEVAIWMTELDRGKELSAELMHTMLDRLSRITRISPHSCQGLIDPLLARLRG